MLDIETKVMQNYQDNTDYFRENHPLLFNKLQALELLLNEGKYPQKYDLEYKNDYFDVINLSSGEFLYKQDSKLHAQEMSSNVSFKKDVHTIETFYTYNYNEETVENLKKMSANHTHATTAPIIDYCKNNLAKTPLMTKILKFMFFGVGLGLHIKKIVQKTAAEVFLITESDIELFRLSMFTCNYKKVFTNKKAIFSVAQNASEFQASFTAYYEYAFIHNHHLKFSLFSAKDEIYIKNIQTIILSRSEHCYAHSALLEKSSRVLSKVQQGYKFLSMLKKDEDFFKDKPILVLGAGPSLGKNKEWLKQHADKFIIIAPFVTLRTLYYMDVAPDIIVHIDEADAFASNDIPLYETQKSFFDNSIFIFSASVSELFFDTFEKDFIYLLEDRTKYKLNNNYLEVASVGESVYSIALMLTAKEIYMLGLDLALGDDGSTHTNTHSTKIKLDTSSSNKIEEGSGIRKSVIEVKGNFRDTVKTIPLFSMSIGMMNLQTQKYKLKNQNIYNLSDGAYFEDTLALAIDDVDLRISEAKVYGAVLKTRLFKFAGFCKDSLSDKIYNVDVYINGECICTLKADQQSKKVESSFDVKGHSFIYELESKYYDKPCYIEFKASIDGKELVDSGIETISREDSSFNRELFLYNLSKSFDDTKLEDSYMKNSIGFLGIHENLEDIGFVKYINELYIRFPQTTFKVFHFDDEEISLAQKVFSEKLDRFEFIVPDNLYDITSNVQVYIDGESHSYMQVLQTMQTKCKNILCRKYTTKGSDILIKDISSVMYKEMILENSEEFGITEEDFESLNNIYVDVINYSLMKDTNLKFQPLKDNVTQGENKLFIHLSYALESQVFIQNIFKFTYLMKKYS